MKVEWSYVIHRGWSIAVRCCVALANARARRGQRRAKRGGNGNGSGSAGNNKLGFFRDRKGCGESEGAIGGVRRGKR